MEHRVQKLLSNYGFCSRRKAEELIQEGKVKVNDKTITIGDKASETDKITVDGKLINPQRKIYLLFNKPLNCVTALKDEKYQTVMDYVKIKERVFPVGRLDYNTSGMLLLTNDGDFANNVTHPSKEIKKTYLVRITEPISNQQIEEIEKGVIIDGRKTVAKINPIEQTLLEITIHEGRNRIVRRIFEKFDLHVISLERIRIGKLSLGNVKQGKFRKLTKKDLDKVFG